MPEAYFGRFLILCLSSSKLELEIIIASFILSLLAMSVMLDLEILQIMYGGGGQQHIIFSQFFFLDRNCHRISMLYTMAHVSDPGVICVIIPQ